MLFRWCCRHRVGLLKFLALHTRPSFASCCFVVLLVLDFCSTCCWIQPVCYSQMNLCLCWTWNLSCDKNVWWGMVKINEKKSAFQLSDKAVKFRLTVHTSSLRPSSSSLTSFWQHPHIMLPLLQSWINKQFCTNMNHNIATQWL